MDRWLTAHLPLEQRLSKKPSKPQPIDAHILLVNPDLVHAFFPSNAQNSSQAIGGRSLEITTFITSNFKQIFVQKRNRLD